MTKLVVIIWIIRFICITSHFSSSFVFVVQLPCTVKSLWTPVPSTVSNFCLQCLCTQTNVSLCRSVLVQLSPGCTSTITPNTVVGPLIDPRTTNTTAPPATLVPSTNIINTPPPVAPPAPGTLPAVTIPPTVPVVPATIVPILVPPPSTVPLPLTPPNPNAATNSTVIVNPPPG